MRILSRASLPSSKIIFRVLFGALLIIFSIRDYLFGNGLYVYRDWSWPLSTSLSPVLGFSPELLRNSGPDPLGFARTFLTWPIVVINMTSSNPADAEKAFIIYLYSVIVFLSFVFSELLLRLLDRLRGTQLPFPQSEAFVTTLVLLSFANLWSVQQLSGFYYTYVIEFFLIAISVLVVFLWNAATNSLFLSGALLSLCIFLDPNLYLYGLLTVSLTIASLSLHTRLRLRSIAVGFSKVLALVAVTVPALLVMLYTFDVTITSHVRSGETYLASSGNLSLSNAVRLLGYWWSLLAYSPPSIFGRTQVENLPTLGSPPFMLLPEGPITVFWLLLTWFVPLFAICAMFTPRFGKFKRTLGLIAVASLILTQPEIFPFPYITASLLSGLPIVGGALVTVLAIPDHALIMLAISYIALIGTNIYALVTPSGKSALRGVGRGSHSSAFSIHSLGGASLRRAFLIGFLVFLLALPAWQFFSGSFYPSSFATGESRSVVSGVGTFSPSKPPQEMIEVYNWLTSQPADFNIYWPGPSGAVYPWSGKSSPSITLIDSPKPTILSPTADPSAFPAGLRYLLSSALNADLAAYLEALNVRYLVTQPLSREGMRIAWGVENMPALSDLLTKTPGISLALARGDVTVYEVEGVWGSIYSPDAVMSYAPTDKKYAIGFGLFGSLGLKTAMLPSGFSNNTLSFDDLGDSLSVLSPSYLIGRLPSQVSLTAFDHVTYQNETFSLQSELARWLPEPWGLWLVTNWGPGNSRIAVGSDSLRWTFGQDPTTLTVSYNGSVTNNHPGGLVSVADHIPTLHIGFQYRTSAESPLSIRVLVPALGDDLTTLEIPASKDFPLSSTWKEAAFDVTLPLHSKYFTPRIQASGSLGWIDIQQIRVEVRYLAPNAGGPFGSAVSLEGTNDLGSFGDGTFVQYQGSGVINSANATYSLHSDDRLTWFRLDLPNNRRLQISGSFNLTAVLVSKTGLNFARNYSTLKFSKSVFVSVESPSSLVYPRPFAPGYRLSGSGRTYSPTPTLDGGTIFLDLKPGEYSIEFPPLTTLRVAYFTTLTFTVLLVVMSCGVGKNLPQRMRNQTVRFIRTLLRYWT